jgi:hypothetical protein
MMDADRAVADALWAQIAADLGAEAPHRAYLEHCARADLLADAARRYREAKERLAPDEAELRHLLDQRLAAIATLAIAQLEARRTAAQPPRSRGLLILAAAIISVGSGALLLWVLW